MQSDIVRPLTYQEGLKVFLLQQQPQLPFPQLQQHLRADFVFSQLQQPQHQHHQG